MVTASEPNSDKTYIELSPLMILANELPVIKPRKKNPPGTKRKGNQSAKKCQEEIMILERREKIFQLRKSGKSYKVISDLLIAEGYPAAIGTVYDEFRLAVKLRRDDFAVDVNDWLVVELEKLDDMDSVIMDRATTTATKDDVKSILDIMKQRDRLIGVSKAQNSENASRNALALLMGVDPNELPHAGDDIITKA